MKRLLSPWRALLLRLLPLALLLAAHPASAAVTVSVSANVRVDTRDTKQTIAFSPPARATYGDAPIPLTATASSGLPVTLAVLSGPGSLNDAKLRITGAGTIQIRASQGGGGLFGPAALIRSIVVAKAPLQVAADDASRLVGASNPAFVLTYTGFVNGDAEADLATSRPVARTGATAKSNAGDYDITVSGGLDANYLFRPATPPGKLTVLGFGGIYEALVFDGDTTPVGKLSLTVPANALTFTGTLTLARESKVISIKNLPTAPLVATSDASSASAIWMRNVDGFDTLGLALTVSADGTLAGSLDRNGEPFADLADGARVVVFAKGQTAPGAGANTLALHPAYVLFDEDQGPIPGGSGHATAAIAAKTGVLTIKGFVADGYPLTATLKPTLQAAPGNTYLLWANPYGTRTESFVAGRLSLQSHPEQSRFPCRYHVPSDDGIFVWKKAGLPTVPAPKKLDKSYRAGFGPLGIQVALDPWLPPVTKTGKSAPNLVTLAQRLGLADSPTAAGQLTLSHDSDELDLGARENLLPFEAALSSAGVFTAANAAATGWKIKLTPTTGAFTGSFVLSDTIVPNPANPSVTKIVPRTVTFSGTLRQAPADETTLGTGFYLLPGFVKTDEQPSGEIRFTAP